jgi:hypothetical protein
MGRDFILTAQRRSSLFRSLLSTIERATDTRELIECIQQAYQARLDGKLTIKLFTALNTLYEARRAALETAPLCRNAANDRDNAQRVVLAITNNIARNLRRNAVNPEFAAAVTAVEKAIDDASLEQALELARKYRQTGRIQPNKLDQITTFAETKSALLASPAFHRANDRVFNLSTAMINEALAIPADRSMQEQQLRKVASQIHTLPLQEKERVRNVFRETRPNLYAQIKNRLAHTIASASSMKLTYFRFAFYEDRRTGVPNEPHNEFHLLNQTDRAETWNLLKQRSQGLFPVNP